MDERLLIVVEMEVTALYVYFKRGLKEKDTFYIRRPLQLLLDAGIHFIFINGHNMIMV